MRKIIFALILVCFCLPLMGTTVALGSSHQEIYWTGQTIEVSQNVDADEVYGIYNGSGDELIQEVVSNDSGTVKIDTEEYGEGEYELYEQESGNLILSYQILDQDFDVDSNRTEAIDETVKYTLESKRGKFDVEVSSGSIDDDKLEQGLQVDDSRLQETDEGYTIEDATQGEEILLDTTPIDEGDYEIKWNVTDTVDETNVTLFTQELPPKDVDFTSDEYVTTLNDKVEISVELEFTDEVEVQIGRNIYTHNVTLEDDDNDGEVSFTFDTSIAGEGKKPVEALEDTEILEQSDDTDLDVDSLAPISYTMEATVGQEEETSRFSVLSVTEPGVQDIVTHVYPGDGAPRDLEDLKSDVIEADTVSTRDYVAYRVDVTSIYQYLDRPIEGSDIEEGGTLDQQFGARMIIEETNPGLNQPIREFDLSDATSVFADEDEQELWVVVRGEDLPGAEGGSETEIETLNGYNATFEIDSDENDIFDEDIGVSTNVSIENSVVVPQNDRTNQLGNDPYIIDFDDPEITVETSLAEERELSVIADDAATDFLVFDTRQIEDGEATFDVYSDELEPDTEFELEIPTVQQRYDFVVGSDNVIENYNIPDEVVPGDEFQVDATVREEFSGQDIEVDVDVQDAEELEDDTYRYSDNLAPGNQFDATITMTTDDQRYYQQVEETITLVQGEDADNTDDEQDEQDEQNYNIDKPDPQVSLQTQGSILEGDSATFEATLPDVQSVFVDYQWQVDGDDQSDTDQSTFETQFDSPGTFNVGVNTTTVEGRSTISSIDVRVYESNKHTRSMYDYFTS